MSNSNTNPTFGRQPQLYKQCVIRDLSEERDRFRECQEPRYQFSLRSTPKYLTDERSHLPCLLNLSNKSFQYRLIIDLLYEQEFQVLVFSTFALGSQGGRELCARHVYSKGTSPYHGPRFLGEGAGRCRKLDSAPQPQDDGYGASVIVLYASTCTCMYRWL